MRKVRSRLPLAVLLGCIVLLAVFALPAFAEFGGSCDHGCGNTNTTMSAWGAVSAKATAWCSTPDANCDIYLQGSAQGTISAAGCPTWLYIERYEANQDGIATISMSAALPWNHQDVYASVYMVRDYAGNVLAESHWSGAWCLTATTGE